MRRIAMVGTASSGVNAPFAEADWELWGVSARAGYFSRADRWFELHRLDGEPRDWAESWRKQLKGFTHNIPELVMMYPEPDLAPKVTPYPYQRIVDRFGTFFMTSSFSWMMALAIDEMVPKGTVSPPGENQIGIFGVEMEYGTEWAEQRVGFRHFIETAKTLGINVALLAGGGLAYEPVPYPMWQDDPLLNKLSVRQKETNDNLKTFEDSLRMTRSMIAQNKGALSEIEMMVAGEGYDPHKRAADIQKQIDALMDTSSRLSRDIVHWDAILGEQNWLRNYLSP